jgi:hypothetical protein
MHQHVVSMRYSTCSQEPICRTTGIYTLICACVYEKDPLCFRLQRHTLTRTPTAVAGILRLWWLTSTPAHIVHVLAVPQMQLKIIDALSGTRIIQFPWTVDAPYSW